MERFFGMMPSTEIEIEKSYKDKNDLTLRVQAGPNGWTIIYADGSSEYRDIEASAEENHKAAYERAVESVGVLVSFNPDTIWEECC